MAQGWSPPCLQPTRSELVGIALVLGSVFSAEHFTPSELTASAIICAGVLLLLRDSKGNSIDCETLQDNRVTVESLDMRCAVYDQHA